jgi:hypothetical protein
MDKAIFEAMQMIVQYPYESEAKHWEEEGCPRYPRSGFRRDPVGGTFPQSTYREPIGNSVTGRPNMTHRR